MVSLEPEPKVCLGVQRRSQGKTASESVRDTQPENRRSEKCPGVLPAEGEAHTKAARQTKFTGLKHNDLSNLVESGFQDTAMLSGEESHLSSLENRSSKF